MLRFKSMPNFRRLCPEEQNSEDTKPLLDSLIIKKCIPDAVETETGANLNFKRNKIYRSSRPDFLTEDEVELFNNLNIKSIIDFRSYSEYRKNHRASKLLDKYYALCKVKVPQWRTYKQHEKVTFKMVTQNSQTDKKHYFINFFNLNYIWDIFNRVPILMRIISLFYLFVDFILGTDRRYFVRFFAKRTLNKQGLIGQYIDIVNNSQASICAALKLLCDPTNFPVMLNCAHGKDRTGIVSAMILSCLGCSREFICQDYAKSAEELKPIEGTLVDDIVSRFHMCPTFITAEFNSMMKVLNYIDDNYGSTSNYLQKIGLSIQEQQLLRDNLS